MSGMSAALGQCRHAQPLVIVDLPGPEQLRAMAAALKSMANDAQGRRLTHRGKALAA